MVHKTYLYMTMKLLLLLALSASAALLNEAGSPTSWGVDPSHSSVTFHVGYLGISEVTGNFTSYQGTISGPNSDLADAQIRFVVDVNSINTDVDARDNHLKSPDFFDAAKFPQMTFESTSFKRKGKDYVVEGTMTIKGVSKPVKFDVAYGGTAKDNYGNERVGLALQGKILRSTYGILGGQGVVDDEVDFALNVNLIRGK